MVSLVDYIRQHSSGVRDVMLPVYSAADRQEIELQTRGQADSKWLHMMREGRVSASIAHDMYTKVIKALTRHDSSSCDALLDIIMK